MEYIVFDCETTGLSPISGDKICEIGAVKIKDGQFLDEYWSLVNPEREVSYSAFMVNKITPGMLREAPTIDEILPEFLEFTGNRKLVAYNVSFDISFLNAELIRFGYNTISGKDAIDIYVLAKKILPNIGRYPLWNVAKNLNISTVATHRALADAQVAAEVFIQLLERGGDKLLNIAHLNYAQVLKALENAVRKKEFVTIKFSDNFGQMIEKDIYPCRVMEVKGADFLEFEFKDQADSIPVVLIEEVG
ncbi:MAG: 3'-5' exonuclease [Candidatus Saelkia tenebricola]|nr:3'-5' exonuclease [Candidatus Saelkia tenebricola]